MNRVTDQHSDWQPRLQFKHETSKVLGRVKGISSIGNPAWNRMSGILYPVKIQH